MGSRCSEGEEMGPQSGVLFRGRDTHSPPAVAPGSPAGPTAQRVCLQGCRTPFPAVPTSLGGDWGSVRALYAEGSQALAGDGQWVGLES